jgi:hypothetical protein
MNSFFLTLCLPEEERLAATDRLKRPAFGNNYEYGVDPSDRAKGAPRIEQDQQRS